MFTKSTSNNKCLHYLLLMKPLTMLLESASYFHKFQFSYCFQSFHVKCRATVTLQSIGGFCLNFLNLTPLIKNPGSASGAACLFQDSEFSLSHLTSEQAESGQTIQQRLNGRRPTIAAFIFRVDIL